MRNARAYTPFNSCLFVIVRQENLNLYAFDMRENITHKFMNLCMCVLENYISVLEKVDTCTCLLFVYNVYNKMTGVVF